MSDVNGLHHTAYRVQLFIDVLPWPERFEGVGLRRLSQLLPMGTINGINLAPDQRSVIIDADMDAADLPQALAQLVRVAEVALHEIDPHVKATFDKAVVTRLGDTDADQPCPGVEEPTHG